MSERTSERGFLVLAAALHLLAACARRMPASEAKRINCPEDQVVVLAVDGHTKRIEGCGRSATYVVRVDELGNEAWTSIDDLKKRAAFDLQCEEGQLALSQLASIWQQGVTGCGKQAVYTYVKTAPSHMEWVLDSATK